MNFPFPYEERSQSEVYNFSSKEIYIYFIDHCILHGCKQL